MRLSIVLPEIQSNFVKGIIEKQEVVDAKFRIYIQDLAKIETVVCSDGPTSFMGGVNFYFLRTKYKNEYREILKELNPQAKYVPTQSEEEEVARILAEMEEDRKT